MKPEGMRDVRAAKSLYLGLVDRYNACSNNKDLDLYQKLDCPVFSEFIYESNWLPRSFVSIEKEPLPDKHITGYIDMALEKLIDMESAIFEYEKLN